MSEAVVNPNKVSRAGVILIKSFEGFRPAAVRRADGVWVIGYGHTASAREGATVSESDAELLLQYDLIPVVRAVREAVTVPLNGHQFDALASFAFSVGVERFLVSDVLVLVNAGRPQDAAAAILGWHDAAEAHLPPRRRTAERALFNTAPGAPAALVDLLMQPLAPFPAVAAPQDASPQDADVAPFPSANDADFGASAPAGFGTDGPLTARDPIRAAPASLDAGAVLTLTERTATDRLALSAANDAPPAPAAADPAPADTRVVWSGDAPAAQTDEAAAPAEAAETLKPAPASADPGSPWPFFFLGALGMVALGAAGAAFRRAAHPGGGDTGLIGAALGVIAVACIAVAGWNLYQRWGRPGR